MAGRSSVLNGLKSSPKGQLCYEEKWKKENMWKCLRQDSLQRVVEEHYPRQRGAETASGAEEPSALGLIGKELKEYARGDRGTDLNPDPLRFPNTAVVAPGRRGSKEGEEAAHSCRCVGRACVCACVCDQPCAPCLPVQSVAEPCAARGNLPSSRGGLGTGVHPV